MHMADAVVSPVVGGAMWAVSVGLLGYSAKKVGKEADEKKVPLMGVVGAFIFTAQMINFSIPGTGSSGHLGGGEPMVKPTCTGRFLYLKTVIYLKLSDC